MTNKLKAHLPKINFLLGGMLFLLSSLSFIGENQIIYGIAFLILGLINLALFKFHDHETKWVTILVLFLNIVGAMMVALDYQGKETKGLHLIWWLIVVLYAIALGVALWKQQKSAPKL